MNLLKTTTLCSALALTFAVAIPASHAQLSVGNSTGVGVNANVADTGVNAGVNADTSVNAETDSYTRRNNTDANTTSVDTETSYARRNNTDVNSNLDGSANTDMDADVDSRINSGTNSTFGNEPSVSSTSRINSEVEGSADLNSGNMND